MNGRKFTIHFVYFKCLLLIRKKNINDLFTNSMVILLLLYQYKCEGEFDCCPFTPWLGTVPIATKLVIMGYLLTIKNLFSRTHDKRILK